MIIVVGIKMKKEPTISDLRARSDALDRFIDAAKDWTDQARVSAEEAKKAVAEACHYRTKLIEAVQKRYWDLHGDMMIDQSLIECIDGSFRTDKPDQ